MSPVIVKDPVETVRIYFERNSWLTIPFSDMRGILGLTHEKANAALKTLEKEGVIKRVAHGKWRYEPRKNGSVQEDAVPMDTAQPSNSSSSTTFEIEQTEEAVQPFTLSSPPHSNGTASVEEESEESADEEDEELVESVYEADSPTKMRADTEMVFQEAFQALKDLYPMGATIEEIWELVGRKGRLHALRARFKEATDRGYARMERAPGVKNRGRGITWKRFWVMDPLPPPVPSNKVALNGAATATASHPQPALPATPAPIATIPPPLSVSSSAPLSLQNVVSNFNTTYIEVLRHRREELSLLLRNVTHLQAELKLVEELLQLAEKQFA